MHIPDGYLGPVTCAATYLFMLPVWAIASRKVKKTLASRQIPLLAVGASFSFVIMMFNIPIPGGSSGHAVGATLVSILLGPWAGCISVTVALVIQAFLFGDGGVTAMGANCLNMAFIEVFAGYYVYKLIAGRSAVASRRRVVAALIAGYAGICLAALSTAVMFGIQPILHRTPSGKPLYCPYGLNIAIPAMLVEHIFIFGWIEAIVTALVIAALQKQNPALLEKNK